MAKKSLKSLAQIMRNLDFCMLTTVTSRGATGSRPMSNNADVAYKGDSYYFTWAKSQMAKDLGKNAHVNLSFIGSHLLKKIFVSVSGKAKLVTDRETMREHWNKDLEIWFKDGVETKGIVMIHVKAQRIKYWYGKEEGEVTV